MAKRQSNEAAQFLVTKKKQQQPTTAKIVKNSKGKCQKAIVSLVLALTKLDAST